MTKNPRLLFYIGFLIFLLGNFSIFLNLKFLEFLQVVGLIISVVSIVLWFMSADFKEKFRAEKGEDGLTYFWNKIAIRLWSGILFMFMLTSTLTYLLRIALD
jgi:hypothetical protein